MALYWREECVVDVLDKDERFIDIIIKVRDGASEWRAIFVYGEPRMENRHLVWTKLRNLKAINNLPWLVIGDFHEAMWDFKHLSITPRAEAQMIAFRNTLEVCDLVDLGFTGLPFTYDNRRARSANVKVRLDHALATNDWRNMFAFAAMEHIPSPCSDHLVVFLKGEPDPGPVKEKCMRYEVFWERDLVLPKVVEDAWGAVGVIQNLSQ